MGFLVPEGEALIWRGPMLHKAIQQLFTDVAWGDLDYLIVDMPPGTGDAQLSLAQSVPLTGGVIVTTPQDVALWRMRMRGLTAFQRLEVPILGIIENMAGDVFGDGGGERAAERSWACPSWAASTWTDHPGGRRRRASRWSPASRSPSRPRCSGDLPRRSPRRSA